MCVRDCVQKDDRDRPEQKERFCTQQYLPDELKSAHYYQPGPNKTEQAAAAYWKKVKGED